MYLFSSCSNDVHVQVYPNKFCSVLNFVGKLTTTSKAWPSSGTIRQECS